MQAYHIHIPFTEKDVSLLALAGKIQGVKIFSLVVKKRLRTVHVFRFPVAQNTSRKSDDGSPDIDDREHQAASKRIIIASILSFSDKPGRIHF